MHWCPILLSVWCLGWVFSVLACLSVDATGALVLLQFISLFLLLLVVCMPVFLVFCFGLLLTFTLVKRTTLCTSMVCAALCLFGGLLVPCMSCPAGLVGLCWFCAPVGASPCLPGFVALLAVLGWALLLPFVVCPLLFWFLSLSSLLSLPRGLSCLVPWSSLYPGLLVPPSGYLVAAVTA